MFGSSRTNESIKYRISCKNLTKEPAVFDALEFALMASDDKYFCYDIGLTMPEITTKIIQPDMIENMIDIVDEE